MTIVTLVISLYVSVSWCIRVTMSEILPENVNDINTFTIPMAVEILSKSLTSMDSQRHKQKKEKIICRYAGISYLSWFPTNLWTIMNRNIHLFASSRGVLANELNFHIVVSKFKLQSQYYIHFRANIFRKGIDPLISQLSDKWYHYCPSKRIALALNNP